MRRGRGATLRLLSAVTALACSLATAEPAATTTQLQDIRVGLTPGRTRLVFDLAGPGKFDLQSRQDGTQLTLSIDAGAPASDRITPDTRGSAVTDLQLQQDEAGTRITLMVADGYRHNLFPLAPHGDRGHRLVLDLEQVTAAAVQATPPADASATTAGVAAPVSAASPTTSWMPSFDDPDEDLPAGSGDGWSGYVAVEARLFAEGPAHPDQDSQHGSVALSPEYQMERDDGRQRIAFNPFFRYDFQDSKRTHADLRELYWQVERGPWLAKAGVDLVFWGVAESQHLVDIINQTDLVENIDGEDKLGQPMLNIDYMTDSAGTWQVWLLPWFRERTFPGRHGRLRTEPPVDGDDAIYDSADEEEHLDLALRWSHFIGNWDIGIAHFSGNSREPLLLPSPDGKNKLVPFYPKIDQTSLDLQATLGAWLWKLEAIYSDNKLEDFYAAVGGFEFTSYGIAGGSADLGWLLEYHYDERGENLLSVFQKDLYAGVRYSGNDIASTQLLVGALYDLDNDTVFGSIEASRRFGEEWVLSLEARLFNQVDRRDPLYPLRRDDYLELQLQRFF